MRRNRALVAMVATVVLAAVGGFVEFAPGAGAQPVAAVGMVTCANVNGGIEISPPLMLPAIGYGGPVATRETVNLVLGGCVAPSVTFTGLNSDPAIDGEASGTIVSRTNSVEGLAGSSMSLTLKVIWYGCIGVDCGGSEDPAVLEPTTVKISGAQAYEGLVDDPGNIAFFFGTTTNSGSYIDPSGNPAGFQGFETTSQNDMPAFGGTNSCGGSGYDWPCFPSPGGSTIVTVTPSAAPHLTRTLCVNTSDLGAYQYVPDPGQGYEIPGLEGPDSGLLGTVSGNLRDDPVSGGGVPAEEYISGYNTTSGAPGCPSGDGSLTVSNLRGSAISHSGVATSESPSPETLTVGEPLTVSAEPASMGGLAVAHPGANCYDLDNSPPTQPGNIVTFEDGSSPDTLCVLRDPGAYLVPGGVGKLATWVFGSTANDIPPASSLPTTGLAMAGCSDSTLESVPLTPAKTSCTYASASGSFLENATSTSVYGDVITAFSDSAEVQDAAQGITYNGYGGTTYPDPDGISYISIIGSDGLTL